MEYRESPVIVDVKGRMVLDSRGNPTVEATVLLEDGTMGTGTVPSGASTGSREALELRDGGPQFGGKGVSKAVQNVNEILAEVVIGMDAYDQAGIDMAMIEADGTENKSKIGANAILAVSLAVAHAASRSLGVPLATYLGGAQARVLPIPMMNVINGGVHADSGLDIQEFMVVPAGFDTYSDALRAGAEVYQALKSLLKKKGYRIAVGDEGGFAPNLPNHKAALETLVEAISAAGYEPGKQVYLALDPAASEFFEDGKYHYEGRELTPEELVDVYEEMVNLFPIVSIEDGMAEQDKAGWKAITERLGSRIMLVGDDVFVTNPRIFREGVESGIANAILIKLNQIGTVTETLDVIRMAHLVGYRTVVSHRSGETEDTTIAHLAVAAGSGFIKTGAPARSERVAKYNELLRIEEYLGTGALYFGRIFSWWRSVKR
ncbi:phosphopyruvate hydratase [Coprothermobacteraceae bacterium]|nr:phosphopyruvate hydratase [Coprothermobacteraceae bacterium]